MEKQTNPSTSAGISWDLNPTDCFDQAALSSTLVAHNGNTGKRQPKVFDARSPETVDQVDHLAHSSAESIEALILLNLGTGPRGRGWFRWLDYHLFQYEWRIAFARVCGRDAIAGAAVGLVVDFHGHECCSSLH
jgi:hypothetical protein